MTASGRKKRPKHRRKTPPKIYRQRIRKLRERMDQQREVMILMTKRIESLEFMRHVFTVRPRDRRRMQQLIELLKDKLC